MNNTALQQGYPAFSSNYIREGIPGAQQNSHMMKSASALNKSDQLLTQGQQHQLQNQLRTHQQQQPHLQQQQQPQDQFQIEHQFQNHHQLPPQSPLHVNTISNEFISYLKMLEHNNLSLHQLNNSLHARLNYLEQRMSKFENFQRGSGYEQDWQIVPNIDGELPTNLPIIKNVFVVFGFPDSILDSYLQFYGLNNNGQRRDKCNLLLRWLGCDDVEKYWEIYTR